MELGNEATPQWRHEIGRFTGRAVKGLALLSAGPVLCCALFYGTFPAAFVLSGEERALEHRGQTLPEVEVGWIDPVYRYYEYRGPLVRGSHRLYERPCAPLDGTG